MPAPTTSLATLRPDLGASFMEFDLEMQQREYIASRVLPVFDTTKQSGKFGRIPIEQLLQNPEVRRAAGGGYNRGNWVFEPDSFNTEEFGWEEPVDDNEAELYKDYFDAEQVSAMRALEFIMQAAEQRAAALLFPGSFTPTPVTNEWDDFANATPITDVEASVQRAYDRSGLWPNAMIINRKVFRNLRQCDQIIDRLKYQGFQDVRASQITASALAQVFDLDELIVAGGTKNTANEAKTGSFSPTWSGEYAMTARIARTNDIREACIGRTFHWGGDGSEERGRVESYRDETVRSDIVRVRHQVDEKLLHSECADLMENITT